MLTAHLVPREAEEVLGVLGNMTPSKSSLDRLPKALSARWEAQRPQFEARVREETLEVADTACTVAVSLDGVMAPMKTQGGGYREASCASVLEDAVGSSVRARSLPLPASNFFHAAEWLEGMAHGRPQGDACDIAEGSSSAVIRAYLMASLANVLKEERSARWWRAKGAAPTDGGRRQVDGAMWTRHRRAEARGRGTHARAFIPALAAACPDRRQEEEGWAGLATGAGGEQRQRGIRFRRTVAAWSILRRSVEGASRARWAVCRSLWQAPRRLGTVDLQLGTGQGPSTQEQRRRMGRNQAHRQARSRQTAIGAFDA